MHQHLPENLHRSGTILIVSTCLIDWGGSEELWAGSVPHWQKAGFRIVIYKREINRLNPRFAALAAGGVILKDYRSSFGRPRRLAGKVHRLWHKYRARSEKRPPDRDYDAAFEKQLRHLKPTLVLISQGINFDGLFYGYQSLRATVPYILVAHKAVDFYWPDTHHREFMIETYRKAKKCFFVSRHNLQLTEEQLGLRLSNSGIAINPVRSSRRIIPYPLNREEFRLACVARLFLLDKGQDMLIRVLAQEKWKQRPVHVTFVGSGDDRIPLEEMAALLGVTNVSFAGQVQNVEALWADHHALVLPSRSEGLPISVVEAMAIGRTVIVTSAGGTAEVVTDEVTGFVGRATQDMLEEAMERAWVKRDSWEAMGLAAADWTAREIPADPAADFSEQVKKLVNE